MHIHDLPAGHQPVALAHPPETFAFHGNGFERVLFDPDNDHGLAFDLYGFGIGDHAGVGTLRDSIDPILHRSFSQPDPLRLSPIGNADKNLTASGIGKSRDCLQGFLVKALLKFKRVRLSALDKFQ